MISAKAILPGAFDANAFRREFVAAAEATNNDWENNFKVTHQTWVTQKPTWRKNITYTFRELTFITDTEHDVYRFLNDGTDVRYAVMTTNFVAKTSPGTFKPGRGHPGFSHMDFNYFRASNRKIDAREWDIQIKNRTSRHVLRRFERAMEKGARGSGHYFS